MLNPRHLFYFKPGDKSQLRPLKMSVAPDISAFIISYSLFYKVHFYFSFSLGMNFPSVFAIDAIFDKLISRS